MARQRKTAVQAESVTTAVEQGVAPVATKIVPKEIDLGMYIPVRNGFQGSLCYISSRTREVFEWENFGDTQEIELRELRNAKSSAKKFFEKNWFMFDEEYKWVISYLGLNQYYKNAINLEDFDDLFKKDPAELREIISRLSDGQRSSVAFRARQLVAEGGIDSLKVISALESILGIELIEK